MPRAPLRVLTDLSRGQVVRTGEAAPSGQGIPTLTVRGASAIEATWSPPVEPNGNIVRYELLRLEEIVYSGVGLSFLDTGLSPNTRSV